MLKGNGTPLKMARVSHGLLPHRKLHGSIDVTLSTVCTFRKTRHRLPCDGREQRAYLTGPVVAGKKSLCTLRLLLAAHRIEVHLAFPPPAMAPLWDWIAPAEPDITDGGYARQHSKTSGGRCLYIASRLTLSVIPIPAGKTDTEAVNRVFCYAVLRTEFSLKNRKSADW